MTDNLLLNVPLLRRRVPNLTKAAKAVGLRPATVSNLCTGKTSVGRAEVRTIVALAQLAECSLDELIIQQEEIRLVETGIKVIDLFAPIVHGGTVGLVARRGSGQMSLVVELCLRLKQSGYNAVFWKPASDDTRLNNIIDEVHIVCSTLDEVYEYVTSDKNEGELLLIADKSVVVSGDLYNLNKRIKESYQKDITTLLVDILFETIDEDNPYGPLDTLLKFDVTLSKRGIFPSIDPVYSTSIILEGDMVKNDHSTIQQRARKLLRRYRELSILYNIQGNDMFSDLDKIIYRRGERLEAFLSQPQYVVEDVTGKQGEWVSIKDTLNDVKGILDGAYDTMKVEQLSYIGEILKDSRKKNK
jgi:F-type H+-transporting ATPase subunit beta